MTMISYAQNREDVLLDRVFPRGTKGFYVDVGANDPVVDSVTKHFSDLGWRGINVEPARAPFERLEEARPRDVNLNVALSDEAGHRTLFEFPGDPSAQSGTLSPAVADWQAGMGLTFTERQVPVITLAQVFEEHVGEKTVDFLSVDVEGHEREVLAGGDWRRWRPRVVVVEATRPRSPVPSYEQWEAILVEADYVFATFDGLNRFYVRSEDASLADALATPVNVHDGFVLREVEELRSLHASLQRQLAAVRAVNETLAAERDAVGPTLSLLRADYEKLERALTNARARCESSRVAVANALIQCQQLQPVLADVRAQTASLNALFEVVGQHGLGVARRLTTLSARFPRTSETAKDGARLALAVKRRLRR